MSWSNVSVPSMLQAVVICVVEGVGSGRVTLGASSLSVPGPIRAEALIGWNAVRLLIATSQRKKQKCLGCRSSNGYVALWYGFMVLPWIPRLRDKIRV